MELLHDKIVGLVKDEFKDQGYIRIRFRNNHWLPDIAMLEPNKQFACSFEIKPPYINYGELRSGLIQSLEGFLYGFRSYYVVSDRDYEEIKKFLNLIPQIGILIYNDNGEFEILKEAENPPNSSELINKINLPKPKSEKRTNRGRPGTAVKVKGYTMERDGAKFRVKPHTRKRRWKKK